MSPSNLHNIKIALTVTFDVFSQFFLSDYESKSFQILVLQSEENIII